MDPVRRRRVFLAIQIVLVIQALILEASSRNTLLACSILLDAVNIALADGRTIRESPQVWMFDRPNAFLQKTLLASYTRAMFKSRMRVSRDTFMFLCIQLGPLIGRQDTRLREAVPVEKRICIALCRLGTGNLIKDIADSYGVSTTTVHRAVREFCTAIKLKLQDKCIKWPSSRERLEKLAEEFQQIRGIPYVVGAIDGSYLPVIAPKNNPQDYYNRKGFHSIILQVIVSAKKHIWDYDVGWAGSLHDSNVFGRSGAGLRITGGHLGPFSLVGDAAYGAKPWMLPPFKGSRQGLGRMQSFWNYVQSSTRMPVECAFGELKSRFRILMKRNDTKLSYVPDQVAACCILHNLCLIHGDDFDNEWLAEAEQELQNALRAEEESRNAATRVKDTLKRCRIEDSELAKASAYSLYRVQGVRLSPMEALARALDEEVDVEATTSKYKAMIENSDSAKRDALANTLYNHTSEALVRQVFGENSRDE